MAGERSTIPGDAEAARQFAAENPDLSTFVEQVSTARSRTAKLGPDCRAPPKPTTPANRRGRAAAPARAEPYAEPARPVSGRGDARGPGPRPPPRRGPP